MSFVSISGIKAAIVVQDRTTKTKLKQAKIVNKFWEIGTYYLYLVTY